MRLRKKKNLIERMELVKKILIQADLDIMNVNEALKDKKYFNYKNIFKNDNEINLEIGCGKGDFIIKMAKSHPEKNFIAVELLSSVIVMAAEKAIKENLNNLIFFNCGADYLPRYIPNNSVSSLYLNFSPPFSGDRYENRRLTYFPLIENYYDFLKNGGDLFLKTDDKNFYEYSFNNLLKKNFCVEDIKFKIKNNQIENVLTEYEKKFLALNLPIFYLKATKS